MSVVARGLGRPGSPLVATGLGRSQIEDALYGDGHLEQGPSSVIGEAVFTAKQVVRSGAQPGRNFRPESIARDIQRILSVDGIGEIRQSPGVVIGVGRVKPLVIHADAAMVAAGSGAVFGEGRVRSARVVSSQASVLGPHHVVHAEGEFFDTELEMMLCAAMSS